MVSLARTPMQGRDGQTLGNDPSPNASLPENSASSVFHIFEHSKALVDGCRKELADLRVAVKATRSHREKSANLVNIASQALLALDNLLFTVGTDSDRLRLLQQLAVRLHAAIDQGEALVKVYGQMNGVEKAFSRVVSPSGVSGKYEACANELKSVLLLAQNNGSLVMTDGASASNPSVNGRLLTPISMSPPSNAKIDILNASGSDEIYPAQRLSSHYSEVTTTVGQAQPRRLRKASRQDAVSGMAYIIREPTSNAGIVWLYLNRLFGSDKMLSYDLSSGIERLIDNGRPEGKVTIMHYDKRCGLVWTGHHSGSVMCVFS